MGNIKCPSFCFKGKGDDEKYPTPPGFCLGSTVLNNKMSSNIVPIFDLLYVGKEQKILSVSDPGKLSQLVLPQLLWPGIRALDF